MIKTTKSQYDEFKKEFMRWVNRFGLHDWKVFFYHEKLDGCFARIVYDNMNSAASVKFNSEVDETDENFMNPKMSAKHEVIHLLLARLNYLAGARYICQEDIETEEERIVNILTKVI